MHVNTQGLDEHQQRMHDATMEMLDQPEVKLMMANQAAEMFRLETMRCRQVLFWILEQGTTNEIEARINEALRIPAQVEQGGVK